jgi:hypothetical protein
MSARSTLFLLALILLCGLPCGARRAQAAPHPRRRHTPAQQDVLAPLRDKWDSLPPHRQDHLLQKSAHWVGLPPRQREEVRQRIERWQRMTPAQRAAVRRDMERFHRLPPERQQQLRAAFERFQQLPPPQRERLLREWQSKSPAEQRQWLHDAGPRGVAPPPSMRPPGNRRHP